MNEADLQCLPHAVVYEASGGFERLCLVGPFVDADAAHAYIDGGNIAEDHHEAWVLPLLPPAADPVLAVFPEPGMCMTTGCGQASAWDVTAPGGATTELCDAHVQEAIALGMRAVPKS